MRAICEFDSLRKTNHFISAEYLYNHGLPRSVDAVQVAETLASMGLIDYHAEFPDEPKRIKPTDLGKHYFETAADLKEEKRKQRLHDWSIAVFSAVSGAFFSKPLWGFIDWLVHLLSA